MTIRQLAAKAGVSAMTVSTVLHGTGSNVRVSAGTAEKIRKIAAELDYQPNALARSFRTRKTGMVGVVCQNLDRLSEQNPYFPQLLNGIMGSLFREGYTLSLCPTLVTGDLPVTISDGRFDGILWARPDFDENSLKILGNSKIPIVMMHATPGSVDNLSTFTVDNKLAMALVVEHLTQLGHEELVFVVDDFNVHTAEGVDRLRAFNQATEDAGIQGTSWVWDERQRTLENYLAGNHRQTAAVCFSDTLAGLFLQGCTDLGVVVPRDLSVVGFDSSSFCDRTVPPLTSVHQPVEQMAFEATTHLLHLIKRPSTETTQEPPVSCVYTCNLDVRKSTAVPPQRVTRIKI